MYQALYRKYRPQTFDDVVGQAAVTQTLKTQLQSNKLSHAYLFTGSRGTGKTSCAKILAKAVNCENSHDGNPCNTCPSCKAIDSGTCMDVLEIDAASNNGVDNVRDLRDDAIYSPSQVKMRVYIIDEVHMLSLSAFNALLKIIEEPPEHLLFILATTELHKVPATILSRCQRFAFRRIGQEEIAERLQYVAYQEGIDLDQSAARVLARLADGGMRDGLSLLDQCASASTGELSAQRVYDCLGIAGVQQCGQLMAHIANGDTAGALALFNRFYAEGKDLGALVDEFACITRDLMMLKTAPKEGLAMLSGVADDDEIKQLLGAFSIGQLVRMMSLVQQTAAGFTRNTSRRLDVELLIVNLCSPELTLDAEALNARLTRLEDQIRGGLVQIAPQKPVTVKVPEPVKESVSAEPVPEPIEEKQVAVPADFWNDIASSLGGELPVSAVGFFAVSANPSVVGVLNGDRFELRCQNRFVAKEINKPEILQVIERKVSGRMGRPTPVFVTDGSAPEKSPHMEQLLKFGETHSDIIKIKE